MTSSVSPGSKPVSLRLKSVWTQYLNAGARDIFLARERGWILAWDESGWITLLDQTGKAQGQRRFPSLVTACAAEDGSAYAGTADGGELWWLAPDLMPRWETKLSHPPLALALDPFGQYLAVSDTQAEVQIFNRDGHRVSALKTPRPLCYLTFVPGAPFLVGSADYGLILAFNLNGDILWLDNPVATVGGLAVDGEGKQILLACFSEGLHRYGPAGQKYKWIPTREPCRLVSQSFEGRHILISNMKKGLKLLDPEGKVLAEYETEKPILSLALGPLAREAAVALAKGPILRLAVLTG